MKRGICVLVLLPLYALQASAQTSTPTSGGGGGGSIGAVGGFVAITSDRGIGAYGGGVVKEKPFCADTEDEWIRTLTNGNHIRRINRGRECRDSQGRTYVEREMGLVPAQVPNPRMIHITDPVDGSIIRLDSFSKTAHVMSMQPNSQSIRRVPVQRAVEPMPKLDKSKLPHRSTEDLGDKEIEGVLAHGERVTTTYPAGSRGNDEPLKDSYETWTAKDLKFNVLAISESDENGVTTHRIKNLQQVEPDPATFQVPPDFTVDKQ
jgi:hypothetical protein